jgi:hypothetical protein
MADELVSIGVDQTVALLAALTAAVSAERTVGHLAALRAERTVEPLENSKVELMAGQ